MAKIAGRLQTLRVGASVSVNGIADMNYNSTQSLIDTTTHDSGAFEESIYGRMSGTISGDLAWDETDAGQVAIETAHFTQATLAAEFRMQTGGGFREFTGTVLVETWNPSGPNTDKASVAVSMKFSGTITKADQ